MQQIEVGPNQLTTNEPPFVLFSNRIYNISWIPQSLDSAKFCSVEYYLEE